MSNEWDRSWLSSGHGDVTALLRRDWDPIFRGSDSTAREDEHAAYADRIGVMLRRGTDVNELADYLFDAEAAMFLLPDDDDHVIDVDVARRILAWYRQAAPAWRGSVAAARPARGRFGLGRRGAARSPPTRRQDIEAAWQAWTRWGTDSNDHPRPDHPA